MIGTKMRSSILLALATNIAAIEYSAIYSVSANTELTYRLNQDNGSWADDHMNIVIVGASGATAEVLESFEEAVEGTFKVF